MMMRREPSTHFDGIDPQTLALFAARRGPGLRHGRIRSIPSGALALRGFVPRKLAI